MGRIREVVALAAAFAVFAAVFAPAVTMAIGAPALPGAKSVDVTLDVRNRSAQTLTVQFRGADIDRAITLLPNATDSHLWSVPLDRPGEHRYTLNVGDCVIRFAVITDGTGGTGSVVVDNANGTGYNCSATAVPNIASSPRSSWSGRVAFTVVISPANQ